MQFYDIDQPLPILPRTFAKPFDRALVTVDSGEFGRVTTGRLVAALDHDWDGELHWMPAPMAERFAAFASEWLSSRAKDMECDMGEDGLSNALLIAHTRTGSAFVDTQLDMDSVVPEILEAFAEAHPEFDHDEVLYLSDAHLPARLVFGRDSVVAQPTARRRWPSSATSTGASPTSAATGCTS